MPGRSKTDPLARQTVLAIAAGRTAIGLGALLASGPALRALGFAETTSSDRALGRLAGSRDIALGLLTIAARDNRQALRAAALAGTAVDTADALTFGLATRDPRTAQAGVRGLASGVAATLAGAWALRRL